MSRSRTRYAQAVGEEATGVLVVPVSEGYALRAAARLQTQGASGMAVLGAMVRAYVEQLGGMGRRAGRPPNLAEIRGRLEGEKRRRKQAA